MLLVEGAHRLCRDGGFGRFAGGDQVSANFGADREGGRQVLVVTANIDSGQHTEDRFTDFEGRLGLSRCRPAQENGGGGQGTSKSTTQNSLLMRVPSIRNYQFTGA